MRWSDSRVGTTITEVLINSMKIWKNLLGGLAGALALNIIHETVLRFDKDAPRVDEVGEEGVNRTVKAVTGQSLSGKQLYAANLAGDIASNSLFYSTIGSAETKNLLLRGAATGISVGLSTLSMTKRMGLDDTPINRNLKAKAMTIGYYLAGGLVAGLTIRALRSRE
jgi:hypothetical protein